MSDSFFIDGVEVKDKYLIANRFNEFFTEIGAKLAAKIPTTETSFQNYLKNPVVSSIGIELTSPSEILLIAKELHKTHSMGLDEIDPIIAKSSIDAISLFSRNNKLLYCFGGRP